MLFLAVILFILKCSSAHNELDSGSKNSDKGKDLARHVPKQDDEVIETGDDKHKLRNDAYLKMSEAFEMREEALKLEFKASILETLTFLRRHATETAAFLKEMKTSLDNVKERVEEIELAVEVNGKMAATIKSRQEVMMKEVRLISLFKMTNQSSYHSAGGNDAQLAVDGQYVFSDWNSNSPMRSIVHTEHEPSKIWIDLGGLFRIYQVKIWNSRHSSRGHFIGVHVYAGKRLLGVGTTAEFIYDYKIAENDPLYAKSVLLHQTHDMWLDVLEVQVWGTGPYSEDDIFA